MSPRPFHGQFVIHRLGHAIINLHTKFELCAFTQNKDMESNEKCRNWGGLWMLWVTKGHRQCHHSVEHI